MFCVRLISIVLGVAEFLAPLRLESFCAIGLSRVDYGVDREHSPSYPLGEASLMTIPVTTMFTIEGYRIERYLGVVRGIIVRSPTIVQGLLGGLKSIVGGQIGSYTYMCEQRQQVYDLMIEHAQQMGRTPWLGSATTPRRSSAR